MTRDPQIGAVIEPLFRRHRPMLTGLFALQWQEPELPAMEVKSSRRLMDWLAASGFTVEEGAGGVPTAFLARLKLGQGPRIAILAEYDALPGLANAAEPRRQAMRLLSGHACGHNHIGPANCGAAIIAAEAAARLGLVGEIAVVGCPAEELLWGKIALLEAGVFEGFDAVLTSHGDYQTGALSRPCQSVMSGELVFSGEAGHGGKPGLRNALTAAERAIAAVTASTPAAAGAPSVQHVLRQAGLMPSITPDEARVWFSVRHVEYERAVAHYRWIETLCADAAAAVGASMRHQLIAGCRGYLANDALAGLLHGIMQEVGSPKWSEADIAWMEALSLAASPGAAFELDRSVALYDTGEDYYGQDDGEISWRIPLGRINWAYPKGVPIHHWAWTALSGHEAGSAGPVMAARVLAEAIVALLAEPGMIAAAQSELARRTQGVSLGPLQLGARRTLTRDPESFWNATWVE